MVEYRLNKVNSKIYFFDIHHFHNYRHMWTYIHCILLRYCNIILMFEDLFTMCVVGYGIWFQHLIKISFIFFLYIFLHLQRIIKSNLAIAIYCSVQFPFESSIYYFGLKKMAALHCNWVEFIYLVINSSS